MKRHEFKITIGDWSGDGHGKHEHFLASAAKPIGDVREAWFVAKEKFPNFAPDSFCNEFEDYSIPRAIVSGLRDVGCPLPVNEDDWGAQAMAAIVVWFLNQGDAGLDSRLESQDPVPTLSFYGFDERERHINFIGYGLFS